MGKGVMADIACQKSKLIELVISFSTNKNDWRLGWNYYVILTYGQLTVYFHKDFACACALWDEGSYIPPLITMLPNKVVVKLW